MAQAQVKLPTPLMRGLSAFVFSAVIQLLKCCMLSPQLISWAKKE
jgi:hypothetical protein